MNAVTGQGIIAAILCVAMENRFAEWGMGICAVIMGGLGIAVEIADRIERKKVAKRGNELSGPSR